jgi:hypothetical protein
MSRVFRVLLTAFFILKWTDYAKSDQEDPKTLFAWRFPKLEALKDAEAKDDDSEEEPIATDRPDFTESSKNVGRGRVQVEMGYTYSQNRTQGVQSAHSYPEMLIRLGVFADWFELRVGQNFLVSRSLGAEGQPHLSSGADDVYIGVGLGLTEQLKLLPESRLLIQSTLPTGASSMTSAKTLPGLNYLYGWEITERISLGGSTQANAAVDADGGRYLEMAQALTVGYSLTKKLGAYTERFAFFPYGATAEGTTAEHYLDGGFTYKVTPNFQLDIRAGVGLSQQADDFFVGSGFAVRR